jgi:hypothetical protein
MMFDSSVNSLGHRLVTIAIDAPNNDFLKEWIAQGLLPNLAELMKIGYQWDIQHHKYYRNENCWKVFTQAKPSEETGFQFYPDEYRFQYDRLDSKPQKAFYSLGNHKRVCSFDLPVPFANNVGGIQINGWASELSDSVAQSDPPELIAEIQHRFGEDPKLEGIAPVFNQEKGHFYKSYPLPSVYNAQALNRLVDQLITSVHRRAEICCALLAKEAWDLFIACFCESHTANHLLWHLENLHPIAFSNGKRSPIFEVTQAIDQAVGKINSQLKKDQSLVIFTIDHTAQNSMDTPSMVFLPEILFRLNFNGQMAIASQPIEQQVEPVTHDFKLHWKNELEKMITPFGHEMLITPTELDRIGDPLSWNPASWYRKSWQRMRAFALPGVSDGYIRLNVKGREAAGLLAPSEFQDEINRLVVLLKSTVNPRTGLPSVEKTIQVRKEAHDDPHLPADLIVCWHAEPADVIEVPGLGQIGPIPFFRTGGHVAHGTDIHNFCVVTGPAKSPMREKHALDLALPLDQFPQLLLSVIK